MQKIKYKYKFDDRYNPKFINGAIGGVSPQGEIIINFYLERTSLPITQTFDINKSTGIGQLSVTEPKDIENSFIRYIENGVVMNYKTAKEIHRWLGEHIKNLEKLDITK